MGCCCSGELDALVVVLLATDGAGSSATGSVP
jgi:hypothetical protein